MKQIKALSGKISDLLFDGWGNGLLFLKSPHHHPMVEGWRPLHLPNDVKLQINPKFLPFI
jgi:hypothetical protein